MMGRINKTYIFNRMELAILFSLKGMKELYGFDLNVSGTVDKGRVNQSLFELSRKSVIVCDNKIVKIQEDIDNLLNVIMSAKKIVFFADKMKEKPEQSFYIGEQIVNVCIFGQTGENVRVELISEEELPEKLVQKGFYLEQIIENDFGYFKDEIISDSELMDIVERGFRSDKNQVWDQSEIKACLIIMSIFTRKKEEQILLFSRNMEDYIAISDMCGHRIYEYSQQKLFQVIAECFGGGNR